MKFAKELEEDLVPEWRVKYFDYKLGKKKITAVAKALRTVNQTPRFAGVNFDGSPQSASLPYTNYDFNRKRRAAHTEIEPSRTATPGENLTTGVHPHNDNTTFMQSPPIQIPETQPLHDEEDDNQRMLERGMTRYGSIVGTPPEHDPPPPMRRLKLPGPALQATKPAPPDNSSLKIAEPPKAVSAHYPSNSSDADHVGQTHVPHNKGVSLSRHILKNKRTISHHDGRATNSHPLVKRVFSSAALDSSPRTDGEMSAYQDLDAKQDEFYVFLDKELDKINSFYRMKEQEACHRLQVLRDQLHEMRDRRMQEINAVKRGEPAHEPGPLASVLATIESKPDGGIHLPGFLKPVENAIRRKPKIGSTPNAMRKLGSPSDRRPIPEAQKDYVRRSVSNEQVPYKTAKRKLKLAFQEFYRALELLKSYALLNRTAFRKINKKYDKAVNARPTLRYMSEKVNKSHFVQSDLIEGHIVAVEDLYARYFEKGSHKIAVAKLRSSGRKSGDFSGSAFRNGILLAVGLVFAIQGLVYAADHLFSNDPTVSVRTSYLLQLHAGYFLSLLLFLCFVVACQVWNRARVNYVFVFEYDTRHVLDWRQLGELPCFFFFLNGLFIWLNFRTSASDPMFIYWPVILIGVTLIIMALPFPILYHHARQWWAFSNWRLLLAGIYPVEFRDFFLGDMYCSEAYAMGNIELFFCLYAQDWSKPELCNSSYSRLLGFFSTLPGIWRALQCLRRYYDSRHWFPHLANCAKYSGNILYYMSLSMYRINKTTELRASFLVFATINATYCSFWDVAMDWSLGNPYAKHPYLRDNLAYHRIWTYYVAMVIDPVLRFQWVFYAIYANDVQHSAMLSFFVALAEVLRRAMWVVFRVENEHCNNVGHFRASRDIPLPYNLPHSAKESQEDGQEPQPDTTPLVSSTGADIETAPQTPSSSLRLRHTKSSHQTPVIRAFHRVGTQIAAAHGQDYEKKKRPGVVGDSPGSSGAKKHESSDDEEDDDYEDMNDENGDKPINSDAEDVMEAQKMLSHGQ